MKKYLMGGIAAVAICAAFTSCSKNSEVYQGPQPEAPKTEVQKYEEAFTKAFGPVGSNVDWGFGSTSKASTRGSAGEIIKPDMTNFPGYSNERCNSNNYRSPEGYADIVAPVTKKEAEWVMDWFSKNPGLSEQGVDFHNYFIQNVGNNGHTKAGYFHSTEGGKPETTEAKNYDGIYMDKLQAGPIATEAGTIHVSDFNATNGFNVWNLVYVKGGSALQFGYHESYGSSYQFKFKVQQLTVPAECFEDNKPHTGWYVGLSYYCKKNETNEKWHEIGIDRLQYADDWVLKIVPGEGEIVPPTPTPTYRVIAEDLNASEKSDFDFNDVVFDVVKAENGKTTLKLIACGGIYKLTVGGVEVHGVFGEAAKADGTYPMINTGKGPEYEPKEFQIDGEYKTPAEIKNIKIIVYKPGNENGIELEAQKGKPACKILVDNTFDVIPENKDISNEYGNFTNYVQGKFDGDFWWKKD